MRWEKVVELEGQLAIVGPEVPLDMGLGIGVRDGHKLKGQFDGALESMKAGRLLERPHHEVARSQRSHILIPDSYTGVVERRRVTYLWPGAM